MSDSSLISGYDMADRESDCFSVNSMPCYLGMIYEKEEGAKPTKGDVTEGDTINGELKPMTKLELCNAISAVRLVEKGEKLN